jgi:polyisoprenyl-teichoic acid--peptidoglycan teichoic acid transferase
MRRFFISIVAVSLVALILREDAPPPPEPPAIELRRTAAATFFEPAKSKVLFVLIIGSDVREGNPSGGRADSLHLLAINTAKRGGTLIGIPRDSYVPIPGVGTEKITASLFFGGPGRVVETVSRLAGVPIHYWALIEFSRFRKLVDALGGVEVQVPYAISDQPSGAFFKAGKKKMNGEEALAFSRARKAIPGGDFGRSSNQGRVLLGALEKFRHDAARPLSLAKYFLAFDQLVETDVKTSELLDLATIGRRLRPWKIRNIVLPGGGGNVGGSSVVNLAPGARDIFKKIRDDALL